MNYNLEETEKKLFAPGPSPFEAPERPLVPCEALPLPETGYGERSLDGTWLLTRGGEEIPDFSDAIPARVPGTVQTALFEAGRIPDPMVGKNDRFAREAAYHTWWYKTEFDYDGSMGDPWLCFDGVCHQAAFYLNGTLLGEHEGMFGGPDFPVGSLLRPHNLLIVKIANSPADRQAYSEYAEHDEGWRNGVVINCVYGWHYACIPSRGIWQGVRLEDRPRCRFQRPFVLTEDWQTGKMGICLKAESGGAGRVTVRVTPYNFEGEALYFAADFRCGAGETLHYTLHIPDRRLWWPNGYGDQPLYRFEIALCPEGERATRYEEVTGIRQIRMLPECEPENGEQEAWLKAPYSEDQKSEEAGRYRWRFTVNGKYIFIKGTNWCTLDALLRFPEERYDRFLSLAKHQNLQLLRAWGGGMPESDAFYRKCDELGLMVQQEWPTCWESPASQPREALLETVRRHTLRLRNHPSLVRWAGGNELVAQGFNAPVILEMGKLAWELDGTRPFHRTSPYAGSRHNYDTYWGKQDMDASLNLNAVFIGEFGMASAPNRESVLRYTPAEEFGPFDPTAKNVFNYHTPRFNECPGMIDMDYLTLRAKEFLPLRTTDDFILGTQLAQAVAIRHTLESQRANSPVAAGVCYYKFTDVYPACSWSTVDYYGVPKRSYYVLKDAFEPLHAMLTVRSVRGAEAYPVVLLDDTLAAAGKDCEVEVIALDRTLSVIDRALFSGIGEGQVNPFGVYRPTPAVQKDMRLLLVRLRVEGELRDSTFYWQNYIGDCGWFLTSPRADLNCRKEKDAVLVTNPSAVPAVGIFLENPVHDTAFTAGRNFFCLLPGESMRVAVSHADGLRLSALNCPEKSV